MSDIEIHLATPLDKTEQHLESLNLSITATEDALDRIVRAGEAVKDETVKALARTASASFAETKRLVDAAGEECRRLKGLGGLAQSRVSSSAAFRACAGPPLVIT